ncbi:MAG: excinuclease ABC subunit A [Bacteroidetes bacterium GWA2_31_9]|nr:MAG: excinuclease ABC subunit A [Bacteroidetes bacterium GWA2_31_9]
MNPLQISDDINVYGARVHNLKNIDVTIPRNKLTVITGLSGSGKSSLAFDTIYAEGQRRYIETFSSYIRQFIGNFERPDVDKITGLSPVISIEQKTTNKNPRSTVGTVTEIYDFLRLLFARASDSYSYVTGEKMVKYTDEQIIDLIVENNLNKPIIILSPVVRGRKGHYGDLFEQIRKKGFLKVRIDGEIKDLKIGLKVDRYKIHNIEIVIDNIVINEEQKIRLKNSISTAMKIGRGIVMILDPNTDNFKYYSRKLMCPTSGISYDEPAPHSFSFNSPQGACPVCSGLGKITDIDLNKIIPNPKLSIKDGGIAPLGKHRSSLIFWQIEAIALKHDFDLNTPIEEIPSSALNTILYGSDETFKLVNTPLGANSNYFLSFDGIIAYINKNVDESGKSSYGFANFLQQKICPECNGAKLRKEALYFKVDNLNIAEIADLDIKELHNWIVSYESSIEGKTKLISKEILKEIKERLRFLIDVGLDYLALNRSSSSLSGGESQRIRLATQIGSKLVNVLYVLDEPSIGLHQRDNQRLINSLKELRDTGNTVIVVEHDKDMILAADYIIDMGPKAGEKGGYVVLQGNIETILSSNSLTSNYLSRKINIEIPEKRRLGNGKKIILFGVRGNNLKNFDIEFPLGTMICVSGVSGSGKSTLINETLYPILSKKLYRSLANPLEYDNIVGEQHIDKVIEVDQNPIGRTPRSNPATYTGIFSDIRKLFEMLPESKIRGYKAGRFSFNVKGGRCETCQGAGLKTIEMNFLPDVHINCETCNGKRYNRETLEVRYKGKSIYDILELTIDDAVEFFSGIPNILNKIKTIKDVGLGYIKLGQSSSSLSGGEAQRIKLAAELSKKDTGNTLYILDEPTTGLHFEDVNVLLKSLNFLVEKGNTVIIIEHNLDVIKSADYIIELGPEGGKGGGELLFVGTPEQMISEDNCYTSEYLKTEFINVFS